MVDDAQENTTPQASAQGEPAKPLTLGAIEAHLLDKELERLARILHSAAKAFDKAIDEASGDGHFQNTKPIRAAVLQCLSDGWEFRGHRLRESMTDESKRVILKRISADFLSKVEEIGQIAEDAASRVEG